MLMRSPAAGACLDCWLPGGSPGRQAEVAAREAWLRQKKLDPPCLLMCLLALCCRMPLLAPDEENTTLQAQAPSKERETKIVIL